MSIFYSLNFLDFPNLEGQIPVFISSRNRVDELYPQALGDFKFFSSAVEVEVK
jgi:hypothetical protein